ncbi:MAG: A24 family peptidase C-terminal domain-containing protein, partial [Candidatus Micrarchaeota archaeon]
LWRLRREFAGLAGPAVRNPAKKGLLGAAAGFAFVSATGALTQFVNPWISYAVVFLAALAVPLPLWAAAIVFAAAAFLDWQQAASLFAFAFIIGFVAFYCVKAFSLVSSKLLRKTVSAKELREGMIPSKTIVLRDGKAVALEGLSLAAVAKAARKLDARQLRNLLTPPADRVLADCRKARGLTEAEIKELKAAGVTSLEVKESLAFAPVLVAGWAAAALWGLSWLLR